MTDRLEKFTTFSAASGAGLHLLLIDPAFHDAGQPGPTRSFDFASRAVAAGHRATVLTTTVGIAPQGRKRLHIGDLNGIHIRARRIVPESGWRLPPSARQRFFGWAAREMWAVAEVDVVFVVAEPWRLVLTAWLFSKARAIPLIVDVRAVPPRAPSGHAPATVRLRAALGRLGRRIALRLADRVIVASPAIASACAALGLPEERRIQLPMGSDTTLLTLPAGADNSLLRDTPELAGHQNVVWAGAFTAERDLSGLISLAAALQDAAVRAPVVLCGDGPARAEIIRIVHARGLPESALRIVGPLPRARMGEMLAAAAVVLSLPSANDTASDFFDGLAAGKPVVYLGEGWPRTLLESRGAGFGVGLQDARIAAREIADILRDPDGLRRAGQQAAALAAGRFNLDRLMAETRVVIEELVAAQPRDEILRRRTLFWKRALDFTVAAVGLIVLSPVLLILAVLIAAKLGWPVVVTQARTGLKGHPFRIIKFRTLTDGEDATGALLPESNRLTPFGRLLRRSALDELPALINVLIGDMSLVGPRPLPVSYASHYTPAQRRRHDLRPGLTGLSQIDTTPDRTWEQKFARDVEYIDRVSVGLDVKIMLKTIGILLRGRARDREAEMPRFDDMMARREGAEDI